MEDFVMLKRVDKCMRAIIDSLLDTTPVRIQIFKYKMIKLEKERRLFEYVHRYSRQPLCHPFTLEGMLSTASSRQLQELWLESLKSPSPLTEAILASDNHNSAPVLLETISDDFPWIVYRNNQVAARAIVMSKYGAEISPTDLDEGLRAARAIPNSSIVEAILTSPYAHKISAQEWALSLSWAFCLQHLELYQTILSSCETNLQSERVLDLALQESYSFHPRGTQWTSFTAYQPLLAQAVLAHPKAKEALSPIQLGNALYWALKNQKQDICDTILTLTDNREEVLIQALKHTAFDKNPSVKEILALFQEVDKISGPDLDKIFIKNINNPQNIQTLLDSHHANEISGQNLGKTLIEALRQMENCHDAKLSDFVSDYLNTVLSILSSSHARKIPDKDLGQALIEASDSILQSDVPEIRSLQSKAIKAILNSHRVTKIPDQDFQTAWATALQSRHYDTILAFYFSKRACDIMKPSSLCQIQTRHLVWIIVISLRRLNFKITKIIASELFHRFRKAVSNTFGGT
jgi:hypothetical protein